MQFQEFGVYPVKGSKCGGIVQVRQIKDVHVFGRFLLHKRSGGFVERDFHSTIIPRGGYSVFNLYMGSSSIDGEKLTVESCDCICCAVPGFME